MFYATTGGRWNNNRPAGTRWAQKQGRPIGDCDMKATSMVSLPEIESYEFF